MIENDVRFFHRDFHSERERTELFEESEMNWRPIDSRIGSTSSRKEVGKLWELWSESDFRDLSLIRDLSCMIS